MTCHLCSSCLLSLCLSLAVSHSLPLRGMQSKVTEQHLTHTVNVTEGNRKDSFDYHLPLEGTQLNCPWTMWNSWPSSPSPPQGMFPG